MQDGLTEAKFIIMSRMPSQSDMALAWNQMSYHIAKQPLRAQDSHLNSSCCTFALLCTRLLYIKASGSIVLFW